jgi:hypothetical protein
MTNHIRTAALTVALFVGVTLVALTLALGFGHLAEWSAESWATQCSNGTTSGCQEF